MKILVLLFAIVLGFGATCKKTADDVSVTAIKYKHQQELKEFSQQPNLLPEVVIVAPRA
ncbi:hypothetical protein [Pontibacter roseus]|uniref:hypothetical protein n=1 Tax=Pontibacter roseus TaxID=336989 RepID=UPI000377EE24|nr:hypothetical protein [Pontibacter roseus]